MSRIMNLTEHSRISGYWGLVIALGTTHGEFTAESSPGNYVINGGFEADADGDGRPDDWKLTVLFDDRVFGGGAPKG